MVSMYGPGYRSRPATGGEVNSSLVGMIRILNQLVDNLILAGAEAGAGTDHPDVDHESLTQVIADLAAEVVRAMAAEGTKAATSALTAETSRATTAEALAALKAANLSDLASAAAARTNLGLGTAATQASGAFDAAGVAASAVSAHAGLAGPHPGYLTPAEGNAAYDPLGAASAALASALAGSQPLDTDLTAIAALTTTSFGRGLLALADAAAGRTALGLGTAATSASSAFDAAGAAAAAQAASQPLDADLTAIAALATTSYGRGLLALADAAAARTALALGTAATQATGAFDTSGAAAAAQAASQPLDSDLTAIAALTTTSYGRGFLALADAAAARTALALGGAAVLAVGTTAGTVAAGDDSRFTGGGAPAAHHLTHELGGTDPLTSFAQVLTPTAVKTSAYTAAAGDLVPVDTTAGAVTITLPTAPADKTRVAIKHILQGGTNAVTYACGGSDVLNRTGGATSGTLGLLAQAVDLQYRAAGAIWYVVADDMPLSQLDLRYDAAGAATAALATATAALALKAPLASPALTGTPTINGAGITLSTWRARVRKAADEIVNNSAAVQNDDELKVTIAASEKWVGEFVLFVNAPSGTADFKVAVTVPTSATVIYDVVGPRLADELIQTGDATTVSGTAITIGAGKTSGATWIIRVIVSVSNSTNAGDIQLQWAQNTATASDTTVKAGSYLVFDRVS